MSPLVAHRGPEPLQRFVGCCWADAQDARVLDWAGDLGGRGAAVSATPGSTPAALAAKAATGTIPIVFAAGGDVVALGLVARLKRPGGNVTGISNQDSEL